ncbi:MAG: PKD domain-containing protein, partial [Caldilineaceae bacterium]|nr:PKD domain-containing protein [Caldilineaceae bacterium]
MRFFSSTRPISRPTPRPGLRVFLLFVTMLAASYLPAQGSSGSPDDVTIFLPNLHRPMPGSFEPQSNTSVAPGDYTVDGLTVPAGVIVQLTGSTVFTVTGDSVIDGVIVADCQDVRIVTGGSLTITGRVDVRCTSEPGQSDPGDLLLAGRGGLILGTPERAADIQGDGDVTVTNSPETPAWEFTLMPNQRSPQKLDPVCSVRAFSVAEPLFPDAPATVEFLGDGLDPDGGPVTYDWTVGALTMPNSTNQHRHTFTEAGTYPVTLTVWDDEGRTCKAITVVMIDDGLTADLAPGTTLSPFALSAPLGEAVGFSADYATLQGDDPTLAWAYGDGTTSAVITGTHAYTATGRYPVTLTVTGANGRSSTATASVYIYDESQAADQRQALAPAAFFCPPAAPPPGAVVVNNVAPPPPPAGNNGRPGATRNFWGVGNVILMGGLTLQGGDGEDGRTRVGAGIVSGGNGGWGGSVTVSVLGTLSICGGVQLIG